ncbi:hypothetical protein PTKIN_Ptkin06aG0031800 [Pterospermum kingtungense]
MASSTSSLPSLIIIVVVSILFTDIVSASFFPIQKPPNNPGNQYPLNFVDGNAKPAPSKSSSTSSKTPRKTKNLNFAADFVSAHNMVRLAQGHEPLKWNYTLAYYAKQWAKKRVNDCKLIHSYGPYGENLFWGGKPDWTPHAVVKSWVEEKAFYDPNSNKCKDGEMCGHYTQVIWKNTASVGCARVRCNNNKGLYVICNYDPPGNYINEHPFGDFPGDGNSSKNSKSPTPPPKPSGSSSKPPPPLPKPSGLASLFQQPESK